MGDGMRESEASARSLAATFKALSDETRLQIMILLLETDELCVCDVVGTLGSTQSKASRHLRYLFNAGLVDDRREGTWMHYSLAKAMRPEQKTVIAALASAVSSDDRQVLMQKLDEWLEAKAVQERSARSAEQRDDSGKRAAPA